MATASSSSGRGGWQRASLEPRPVFWWVLATASAFFVSAMVAWPIKDMIRLVSGPISLLEPRLAGAMLFWLATIVATADRVAAKPRRDPWAIAVPFFRNGLLFALFLPPFQTALIFALAPPGGGSLSSMLQLLALWLWLYWPIYMAFSVAMSFLCAACFYLIAYRRVTSIPAHSETRL